jgi:hypothetical protein
MLSIQPLLLGRAHPKRVVKLRGFAHAMELFKVQCESEYLQCDLAFIAKWREAIINAGGVNNSSEENQDSDNDNSYHPRRRRRKGRNRRSKRSNQSISDQRNYLDADEQISEQIAAASEDLKLGF